METLLGLAVAKAGADAGALVLLEDRATVRARWDAERDPPLRLVAQPLAEAEGVPRSAVVYALRVGEALLVDDVPEDPRFARDPHLLAAGTRSLLALPLRKRGASAGILVLENRLAPGAFTPARIRPLTLMSSQMATALDNARLVRDIRASPDQVSALSASYSRFVPAQLIRLLGKDSILDVGLGDQVSREMSVLFADVRGFTTLSERLGPARTFAFINAWARPR